MAHEWISDIKWGPDGLIAAVAQDATTGQVLMVAWMNQLALETTVEEGRAVYWSRSRARLWRKGEESGHEQRIREIRLDCDGDAVLLAVEQKGGIACHTGRVSCFFRRFSSGSWLVDEPVVRSPDDIYPGPKAT